MPDRLPDDRLAALIAACRTAASGITRYEGQGPAWVDEVLSALEELAERRAAPAGWQPIETAPKDGCEIMLGCYENDRWVCQVCKWRTCRDEGGVSTGEGGFGWGYWWTHWCDAPKPRDVTEEIRAANRTPANVPEVPHG